MKQLVIMGFPIGDILSITSSYKQVHMHTSCLKMILWLPERGLKKQI